MSAHAISDHVIPSSHESSSLRACLESGSAYGGRLTPSGDAHSAGFAVEQPQHCPLQLPFNRFLST